jgi:hypothetical protein
MIKEIRKDEVPEWEYGDVAIKTYSFGEQMAIAGSAGQIKESIEDGKKTYKPEMKADINFGDLSVYILCAGIHYVRDKSGENFLIKPNTTVEDKKRFVFNFPSMSGNFLLNEIREFNKPKSDEEKKV